MQQILPARLRASYAVRSGTAGPATFSSGPSYLRAEPCADAVASLLRSPTVLTAANAAEVLDQLVRVCRRDPDDVHADIALLATAGMEIIPVTADHGLVAGRLRARYYHRQRCAVSLADCLAAAAALGQDTTLATSDPALAEVVRAEGGQVHPLADSKGAKP
ncbi:MAG: PIN domain-containing protein [Nocardioidaceae bacterium]